MGRGEGEKSWTVTSWLGLTLLGRLDEARARKIRDRFGRSRWLVSWQALPGGAWRARISGPGHPETIESAGRTRVEAIRLAARVARMGSMSASSNS